MSKASVLSDGANAKLMFVYRGAVTERDLKAEVGNFHGRGMGLFHPLGQDSWPHLN